MVPFDKILFPVDFSEASAAMVPDVAAMARKFNATVIVLHAFHIVYEYPLAPHAVGNGAVARRGADSGCRTTGRHPQGSGRSCGSAGGGTRPCAGERITYLVTHLPAHSRVSLPGFQHVTGLRRGHRCENPRETTVQRMHPRISA